MAAPSKTPQNLSPDLKEIYDRVMNTPGKTNTTPSPNPTPQPTPPATPTPTTPGPTLPQPTSTNDTHTPSTQTPATPAAPPLNAQLSPAPPSTAPTPPTPPADGATPGGQPFLTSTPPRPLKNVGVNSFSPGGSATPQTDAKKKAKTGEKKGLSKPIIITLGIVFFVVWAGFWYIFFFKPF